MKKLMYVLMAVSSLLFGEEFEIYNQIADIRNPTIADLQLIQYYISHSKRPMIARLKDKEFIPQGFRFVGDSPNEYPKVHFAVVNSPAWERENCVIIYSSFNERYPKGAKRLFDRISNSDFKGHVYCRIGGWPDLESGSLVLAHVPFAFKPCFFREMRNAGYKRVLWVDASILPYASLNKIFGFIREKGYYMQANVHNVDEYMNEDTARYFGLTCAETAKILSCSAAIIGMDFTDPKVNALLDAWYDAAKDPYAFYSPRSDQTALSILMTQMEMTDWFSPRTLGGFRSMRHETLFIMDREYVK